MSLMAAWRRYVEHPDPATSAANKIALIVGSNGPFYPLYVWWLAPSAASVAWLTMLTTPIYLATPWLSRRNAMLGQAVFTLSALLNTVWCSALLGSETGLPMFVLPCIAMAVFMPAGRIWIAAAGLAAQQAIMRWPWATLVPPTQAEVSSLYVLNATSAAVLLAAMVVLAASIRDR